MFDYIIPPTTEEYAIMILIMIAYLALGLLSGKRLGLKREIQGLPRWKAGFKFLQAAFFGLPKLVFEFLEDKMFRLSRWLKEPVK